MITLKAYHGSNQKFSSFSKAKANGQYNDQLGFFFTNSKWDAGFYGDIVYHVILKFKKPYKVSWSQIDEELDGDRSISPWSFGIKTLVKKGYDSVIIKADKKSIAYGKEMDDHEYQYDQYVAFYNEQIKITKVTSGESNKIISNPVPPRTVSKIACRGLAKRRKYKRGGTSVGVARARDLCNRANVSMRTVKRMSSYFARHRASRATNAKRLSDPTSPASIADDLWGGTAGMNWARRFKPR